MPEHEKKSEVIIYKAEEGPEVKVRLNDDTAWLTLQQMADLFGRDKSVISRHIKNIFNSSELSRNSVVAEFATTASDGKVYRVEYYNLDMIISVGYRVNSRRGTQFRIWATQKLRDYIVTGYVLNERRLRENQDIKLRQLEQANKVFLQVIQSRHAEGYEKELLSIITDYTNTWFLLNQYDRGELSAQEVSRRKPKMLEYEQAKNYIEKFKQRLVAKKEASDLFGRESGEKFKAILGNIGQTFGQKDVYPSVDEKAAHLLYFVIKDHPFTDGNKRIGSLLFMLFLVENRYLNDKKGGRKINDAAMTALALLIAESRVEQKDAMIHLIINLLNR